MAGESENSRQEDPSHVFCCRKLIVVQVLDKNKPKRSRSAKVTSIFLLFSSPGTVLQKKKMAEAIREMIPNGKIDEHVYCRGRDSQGTARKRAKKRGLNQSRDYGSVGVR